MMPGEKKQKSNGKESPGQEAGASAPMGAERMSKITVQEIRFYYIFQAMVKPGNMLKKKLHGQLRTNARAIEHKRTTD